MSSEMPTPDGEMAPRFILSRRKQPKARQFLKASMSFSEDGSMLCYRPFERDSQTAKHWDIPEKRTCEAVYQEITYLSPTDRGESVGRLYNFLIILFLCITVLFTICFIYTSTKSDKSTINKSKPSSPGHESSVTNHYGRDLLDFLEVAMTNVFDIITVISNKCCNALYLLSYLCSFTTSLCWEILFFVHWMLQSACHFILWIITASPTFMNDSFLLITGCIIFPLIGLGYLLLIYQIKKLSKTNAAILEVQETQKSNLKQVEKNLTFEKEKNCANLNETQKLKLKLNRKDDLNLTLRYNNLNLKSQRKRVRLELLEIDKLNLKLELQKYELQLEVDEKKRQNVVLILEKVKLKSEKEAISLKLNEEEELNEMLESTVSQLESEKEKLKSEKRKRSLKLKEAEELNVILESTVAQLKSEKERRCLKLKEAEKLNVVLGNTVSQLKSEKKKRRLKLKEAEELNVILEGTGSQLKSQNQKLKLELEKEKDQRLCDVCSDNYKNMLLLPCKHFSLCTTCWHYQKWSKCPICRQDIESAIDVYD